VLGAEHRTTIRTAIRLGGVYGREGKYEEGEELESQALEISRRVLGPEHPDTLLCISNLASLYQQQRKFALAETYAAQVLASRRKKFGSAHPHTMISAADLATAYVSQRKFAEAEPLAREALDFWKKSQPGDWQQYRSESLLGACFARQKKYAEAEPLLLEGYQGMLPEKGPMRGPDRYLLDGAHEWLIQMYVAWGKPEKAAEWRRKQKK
jgi:tetratricopeptide (TPR) repeat protein